MRYPPLPISSGRLGITRRMAVGHTYQLLASGAAPALSRKLFTRIEYKIPVTGIVLG